MQGERTDQRSVFNVEDNWTCLVKQNDRPSCGVCCACRSALTWMWNVDGNEKRKRWRTEIVVGGLPEVASNCDECGDMKAGEVQRVSFCSLLVLLSLSLLKRLIGSVFAFHISQMQAFNFQLYINSFLLFFYYIATQLLSYILWIRYLSLLYIKQ